MPPVKTEPVARETQKAKRSRTAADEPGLVRSLGAAVGLCSPLSKEQIDERIDDFIDFSSEPRDKAIAFLEAYKYDTATAKEAWAVQHAITLSDEEEATENQQPNGHWTDVVRTLINSSAAAAAAAIARFAAPQASTAEQRVQACASRLAGSARCVDALIASLERAIANPEDERCRKVSLTNKAFRERVGSVPGGVDFLYAVGFEPMHGHLVLQRRDTALLWVGKAALQAAQESLAYRGSKEALQLREALQLSSSEYAAEEAARRQAWLQKVPDEPPEGQAGSAKICVHVGEARHWRRFDSSEVLEDVVNFARSLPGVPLGRPIGLSNVTLWPAVRLDLATECGLTLQRLDLWPAGHLRVEAG